MNLFQKSKFSIFIKILKIMHTNFNGLWNFKLCILNLNDFLAFNKLKSSIKELYRP